MLLDHVDIRVSSLQAARPLFDALLPAMGFSKINADAESAGYHRADETGAEPFVWLVEDAQHRPNGTRIAFAASSRDDVDRYSKIALDNGATAYEPPELVTEYGQFYYASFFEDGEGNKFEICCRRRLLA